MWRFAARDESQTRALGAALGRIVAGPTFVALNGDLGAGKTCFAQGLGAALKVDQPIVSPTFVLMAEYQGTMPLLHADTYRLSEAELPGVGLEEALDDWPGVALVEWADRFPDLLPADHLKVDIHQAAGGREFMVCSTGPIHSQILKQWREEAGESR